MTSFPPCQCELCRDATPPPPPKWPGERLDSLGGKVDLLAEQIGSLVERVGELERKHESYFRRHEDILEGLLTREQGRRAPHLTSSQDVHLAEQVERLTIRQRAVETMSGDISRALDTAVDTITDRIDQDARDLGTRLAALESARVFPLERDPAPDRVDGNEARRTTWCRTHDRPYPVCNDVMYRGHAVSHEGSCFVVHGWFVPTIRGDAS